jgi:hypothetical protein
MLLVELTPTGRTLGWLAKCFLEGLGKESAEEGASKGEDLNWSFVVAWLEALCVRRIVIWRAHLLQPRLVDEIMMLAARLRLGTTFIAQPRACPRGLNEAWLRRWMLPAVAFDEWGPVASDALGRGAGTTTPEASPAPEPAPGIVPDVDFTLFRARCRRELDTEWFTVIDGDYCREAQGAVRSMGAGDVSEASVFAEMGRVCSGMPMARQIARIRGLQAGAFVQGWLVNVESERLLACLSQGHGRPEWTEETARKVYRCRSPLVGAFGAVLGTAQCSAMEALKLTVSDVRVVGAAVRFPVGGDEMALEGVRALPLVAYACWRREIALSGDEPFWVSMTRDHPPLGRGGARTQLAQLGTLTGQPFGSFNSARVRGEWRYRNGLSVQRLA